MYPRCDLFEKELRILVILVFNYLMSISEIMTMNNDALGQPSILHNYKYYRKTKDPLFGNDFLRLNLPSSIFPTHPSICDSHSGLTKKQIKLCYNFPDMTSTAYQGVNLAIKECKHQLRKHRWDCSTLIDKSTNFHSTHVMKKGYRESAFAAAMTSAGMAHAVARSCSMGRSDRCDCSDISSERVNKLWKWGGCTNHIKFGMKFSKILLDSLEQARDLHSIFKLHNNKAGRLAVGKNTEVRCKCHGMSGSCEMKTCWRAAANFRKVGTFLKKKYRTAQLVDLNNNAGREKTPFVLVYPTPNRRVPTERELVYYERSPSYCDANPLLDSSGTAGRVCNKTSVEGDNCESMCCGRGYNVVMQRKTERCNCRFIWCCEVVCQNCTTEEWITVCK